MSTIQTEAFKLRMRSVTVPVLQILDSSLEVIENQLEALKKKTPNLFKGSPMIVDLELLGSKTESIAQLMTILKRYGIIPIGVQGANVSELDSMLDSMGIAIFSADRVSPEREVQKTAVGSKKSFSRQPAPPAHAGSKIVTKPVRSGQQVYAEGGDLIVLGSVSPGAELLADGHIHVYGTLRGRALAGIQGNQAARIFCQNLEADLLAIAGCYMTSETIDRYRKEGWQQVALEEERLIISAM